MIFNRVFTSLLVCFLFILILPSWTYKFEACCTDEKTPNTTSSMRLLSCPLNFVIKLRTVIFYTGNGCAPSACQRRLNKHYLACNNHRTCSISVKCIRMDSSTCSWITKSMNYSQHLIIDYDCILYEPEQTLLASNRFDMNKMNNKSKEDDDDQNIVLFSAKIDIETPSDLFNDSLPTSYDLTHDERAWKEFLLKQYLSGKRPPFSDLEKPFIIQQQRSLFSDILRTVIILIVFTFILLVLMLIGLFLYKHITFSKKRRFFSQHHKDQQQKHEPFPADEAYDNLKSSAAGSITDSGAVTDV